MQQGLASSLRETARTQWRLVTTLYEGLDCGPCGLPSRPCGAEGTISNLPSRLGAASRLPGEISAQTRPLVFGILDMWWHLHLGLLSLLIQPSHPASSFHLCSAAAFLVQYHSHSFLISW